MQNTITARQIGFNFIALAILLVAVAILAGFVAGRVSITPAMASVSPASNSEPAVQVQSQAPISGWLYRYALGKWYAVHLATTSGGTVVDDNIELRQSPNEIYGLRNTGNGCRLDRAQPDC